MTQGAALIMPIWHESGFASCIPHVRHESNMIKHKLIDYPAVCSGLKIYVCVMFLTIDVFHEVLSEVCELALGKQGGSCMVKVDSS